MTKHWTVLVTASLASLLAIFAPTPVARADIFKWKYINPANHALGKQQSTTLTPDGAGVNAEPGADLSYRNLTKAYLIGADLTGAYAPEANLTNADLSEANLTNASFSTWSYPYGYTDLTGANFTNAQVRGAGFHRSNLSTAQLYSTASYQDHDLSGIYLSGIDLTGANLAGQKLTNAGFSSWPYGFSWHTILTGANLSGADVRGAQFSYTPLTGVNFTGAEVRGANFSFQGTNGITAAQLYSTASYQARDLTGIGLAGNDLTGANLADQNLMNAGFTGATLINANLSRANLTSAYANEANLTGANLSQANLTNANFAGYSYPEYDFNGNYLGEVIIPGANLSGANLNGADTRGANSYLATWAPASATNLIQSGGHIAGLDLTAGASLVVRDYDGNPAASPPTGTLPIAVDQHLVMDATGTLRLVFDADPWDSTISFAPGIPVTRGGTLELTFAPGVNLASQNGRTIDLFDWTGVTPTGAFTITSPYTWNLSNLYTTGEVTLSAVPGRLPGDFNGNGSVDAADYVVWRKNFGTQTSYDTWRAHFGHSSGSGATAGGSAFAVANLPSSAVPEPISLELFLVAVVGLHFIPRDWVAAKNRC